MSISNHIECALSNYQKKITNQDDLDDRVDILINGFNVTIYRKNKSPLVYIPERSSIEYHSDIPEGVNFLVKHSQGAFGSGKSLRSMIDFLYNPPPPCNDGIIRQRSLMCRSTYRELATTTIRTYLDWFGDSGQCLPGKSKKYIQQPIPCNHARYVVINNGKKYLLEWEVNFLAFEHENDIEKLKSIEATDAFWNEVSGVIKELYTDTLGRTGRYPKQVELDLKNHGADYQLPMQLKSDTNPPTKNSWLYKTFEIDKPNGYKIYKQPPGLIKNCDGVWETNPLADNLTHLAKNYYLGLMLNRSEESIRVYCCGEYGIVAAGSPVYPEYNDDWHSVDDIKYDYNCGIYLGWDFGLTPCLLVCQFVNGQLRAIKEFCSENFGIENLIDSEVIPWFNDNKIFFSKNNYRIISVADPAGNARSAKNIFEPNLIEVICKKFVTTVGADSNKTEIRLESVRTLFNRNVGSPVKASILISRNGCPILREGLLGKYYITESKISGQFEKQLTGMPVKTHPHSEPQDCLQYIALKISALGLHGIKNTAIESMKDQITGMRR